MTHQYTFESAKADESFPSWHGSPERYPSAKEAMDAASEWLLLHHKHGQAIQVRLKRIVTDEEA